MTCARCRLAVLALALLACGDDDDASSSSDAGARRRVARDAEIRGGAGARPGRTGVDPPGEDAPRTDAGDARVHDDAMADAGGASDPDASAAAPCVPQPHESDGELTLFAPPEPPPGAPFIVEVRAVDTWSGAVALCLGDRHAADLRVYRGRGSASLQIARAGMVSLSAHAVGARGELALHPSARPQRRLAGTLLGADLAWDAGADIVLTANARVQAGSTLAIAAGTRVLLEAKVGLDIEGELITHGEASLPVLFTRAADAAWGGIRVMPSASARLQHTWLTGGGSDSSLKFGHSSSQPVVFADSGASLEVMGGGIVDNPGKALGSSSAHVALTDVLLSRCDTGGELGSSVVLVDRSYVLEIPDGDGLFADNDNDGLYFSSPYEDESGVVPSLIRDSVFAVGEDDAIDHNNAELRIERVWIEGFRHEGVAASAGHTVTIRDSVVRGCGQGIEAGYGAPQVVVEHCLITENGVGLRVGDSYDWETSGSLTVSNSISVGNHDANARNYVEMLKGPLEGALRIRCSLVDDASYDGRDGNLAGIPLGDFAAIGCAAGPTSLAPECDGSVPGPTLCF